MDVIQVTVNNIERKIEYKTSNPLFQEKLNEVLEVFDIQGNITGISHDGGTKYGVYCVGKLEVSPVDLSNVKGEPLNGDLISFKIDLSDNSIKTKAYYFGNIKGVKSDKNIIGTGLFVGEDTFTMYFTEDETEVVNTTDLINNGFKAITYYADGTTSNESEYTNVPS